MQITLFRSDKDTQGIRTDISWEGLVVGLSTPAPSSTPKNLLPMWSPAVFTGDVRRAANVEQVSCLVFDVDESPVPTLADIAAALSGEWFAHSSSSSTLVAPRWRLLLRLSRPLTRDEHATAWAYWKMQLPFPVGAASKDCSRAWYAPRLGADESFQKGPFVQAV